MLERVSVPVSLGHLHLYLPSKISQKHLRQRYGKAKGGKKGMYRMYIQVKEVNQLAVP